MAMIGNQTAVKRLVAFTLDEVTNAGRILFMTAGQERRGYNETLSNRNRSNGNLSVAAVDLALQTTSWTQFS